jgi:hypothetical protein
MSVKHDKVKKNRAKCSVRGKTCRSSLVLTALTTMGKCNDRELPRFQVYVVYVFGSCQSNLGFKVSGLPRF